MVHELERQRFISLKEPANGKGQIISFFIALFFFLAGISLTNGSGIKIVLVYNGQTTDGDTTNDTNTLNHRYTIETNQKCKLIVPPDRGGINIYSPAVESVEDKKRIGILKPDETPVTVLGYTRRYVPAYKREMEMVIIWHKDKKLIVHADWWTQRSGCLL